MRDVLTGLAVAIITLLSLALAGPLLVNWTGQRARIETVLAGTLGLRVQIAGPIDMRLLPTPRLVVERAQIGERPGPVLSADRIAIEIATMPLLKGEIRVLESRFSGARLLLTRQEDGGFALPAVRGTQASIEKLFVSDGRLQIRDAAGQVQQDIAVSGIEADAGALAGPWRINGRVRAGAQTRELRLALGAPDEQGQRVRLTLIDDDGDRSDFDGRLSLAAGTAEGKATRQGKLPWPAKAGGPDAAGQRGYTITSSVALKPGAIRAEPLDVELGDDVASLKLSGRAEWMHAAPLAVRLEGKSLDLDRPLRGEDGVAPPAAQAMAAWARVLGGVAGEVPAMGLDLSLPHAILGGDALRALTLKTEIADNAFRIVEFSADTPGQSLVTARGDLAFGVAPRFSGPVKIDSRDPARFAAWLEGDAGRQRFPLRADLKAEGDLFITRETIAASKLSFVYDRTQVTGAMRLQRLGERPKLEAQLASDRLALEAVPDFSGLGGSLDDLDALLSFEVRQLDFGQEWRGGKMRLRIEKLGGRIALPLFEMTDQAGLSVRATGNLQGEGGRLDATLDLPQLAPLAQIARRFGGGPLADAVAARATSLSPFKGRVVLFREKDAYRIEANGKAAATDMATTLRASADQLDGQFEIRAAEAAGLLKQAGLTVVAPFGRSTPARITGAVKGPAHAPQWQARFESGQSRISFDGVRHDSGWAGQLRGESEDVTPWLQMLAWPAPMFGERVPMQFETQLRDGEGLTFDPLEARFGPTKMTGRLSWQGDVMGGALTFDALSFENLAGLSLGAVPAAMPSATWPSQRFTPPVTPPFRTAIVLSAPLIALPFGLQGEQPRLELRWGPDGLDLTDIAFGFAGGEWRGALALKRQGGLASFSSRTQWNGVDLARVWPQSGLAGRATMTLDLGASGESVSAMVVALSGGGRLKIEEGRLDRLDARRVLPVVASADQGRDVPDSRALRDLVTKALDSGPFGTDAFDTTMAVANGVVRIGPATLTSAFTQGQALALYDLKTMKLDARLTIQSAGASDWAAPPQWSVQWRTLPNGTVTRDVDVSTLANLLTTRYVARELARIEAEEAELRERNFFLRRQRSEKARYEEQLRQQEIKRAEDEARRARDEAEKILNVMPPPVEPAVPNFQ